MEELNLNLPNDFTLLSSKSIDAMQYDSSAMKISQLDHLPHAKLKIESPPRLQLTEEESIKDQPLASLSKQNSILSLTLDEIQFKSGKSFGSMNMDEFLASIWSVEENPNQSLPYQNEAASNKNVIGHPNLIKQGSISIPTPLCNKTVDEVWFEIHKEQQHSRPNDIFDGELLQRQQTLGEMTLEDFLVKAGVVQEPSALLQGQISETLSKQQGSFLDSAEASLDTKFGARNMVGYGFPTSQNVGNHLPPGSGFTTYQFLTSNNRYMGEPSSDLLDGKHANLAEAIGLKPRRIIDGPPEVIVERRQRRMIKNRESAARSRARKQAYTVELEVELNQLKEENEKLKKIVAEAEQNHKREVLKRKYPAKGEKATEKFRNLRRTSSTAW